MCTKTQYINGPHSWLLGNVQNCNIACFVSVLHVFLITTSLSPLYRVKKLKTTPIYVKPRLTSDAGTCHVHVLVGTRNDPGKTIDSITVQFQLPECILSADLTSNHGTVNILANKVSVIFRCDTLNTCPLSVIC